MINSIKRYFKNTKQYSAVLFFFFISLLLSSPLQVSAQDGCTQASIGTSVLGTLISAGAGNNPIAAQTQTAAAIQTTICQPLPRIKIPGLEFTSSAEISENIYTDPETGDSFIFIPFLGEYISAVYRYGVALAGVLIILILIVSGIQWVFGGASPDNIDAAKERIKNAMIGLLIITSSFTVLYIINPELTSFKSLKIEIITGNNYFGGDTQFEGVQEPGHYQCTTVIPRPDLRGDTVSDAQALGFYCPTSGGPTAIKQIAESMRGKVVYRFGGKGGEPPYSEKAESQFGPFNCSCPPDTICLDCSGFVKFVYQCAGLDLGTGTSNIFSDDSISPILIADDVLSNVFSSPLLPNAINVPTINNVPLYPGDLLGWRSGDKGEIGHVIMYIGNGKIAEAIGSRRGRNPGTNPRIRDLDGYPFPENSDNKKFFRVYKITNSLGYNPLPEEALQWVTGNQN